MNDPITLAYLVHEVLNHKSAPELAESMAGEVHLAGAMIDLAPNLDAGYEQWERLNCEGGFTYCFAYSVVPEVAEKIVEHMVETEALPDAADVSRWTVECMEDLEREPSPTEGQGDTQPVFTTATKRASKAGNVDWLASIQCPHCGSEDEFEIVVQACARVVGDRVKHLTSENEWDDDSRIQCMACRVTGTVGEFSTTPSAETLLNRYDTWGEHPDYPVDDWRYEANNGDTRRGYWEWVAASIERDAEV